MLTLCESKQWLVWGDFLSCFEVASVALYATLEHMLAVKQHYGPS